MVAPKEAEEEAVAVMAEAEAVAVMAEAEAAAVMAEEEAAVEEKDLATGLRLKVEDEEGKRR